MWKENVLFREFIRNISYIDFLSDEDSEHIFKEISEHVPVSVSGHIEWKKVKNAKLNVRYDELKNYLDLSDTYFIIWDNSDIPTVKCTLESIVKNVDDIEAVAFSFIIVSEKMDIFLESVKFGKLNLHIRE